MIDPIGPVNTLRDDAERPTASAPPRIGYTVKEVAHSSGLSARQIYVMCKRGEIRSTHVGRRRVIPVAAFAEFRARLDLAAS